MQEIKFPIYYVGASQLFSSLQQSRIKDTLMLPHPCVIHQTIQFIPIAQKNYLEPIVTIMVLNEAQGEQIAKGHVQLTQPGNTLYVYYPYQLQVDEFVYKQANSSYENMIKQIPRAMKDYFCKYVEWRDGKGDNSIQGHNMKLVGMIQREAKIQIEKRVNALIAQIHNANQEPVIYQKLYRLWMSRTKLGILYENLNLNILIWPLLQSQYATMVTNLNLIPKCKISSSFNPTLFEYDSFFIKLERSQLDSLQIMTQLYLLMLKHLCLTIRLVEALALFHSFLKLVRQSIISSNQNLPSQILFKLWQVQLIQITLKQITQHKGLLLSGKSQIQHQIIEYKIYSRKIVHWISKMILNFSTSIFSLSPKQQSIQNLLNQITNKSQLISVTIPKQNQSLRSQLSQFLSIISNNELKTAFESYQQFIIQQFNTLANIISFLKQTKFKRLQLQLRTQFFKLILLYDELSKQTIQQLLKSQKNLPIQFPSWTDLFFVYQIYVCRVLNKIQDPNVIDKLLDVVDNSLLGEQERKQILKHINKEVKQEKKHKQQIGSIDKIQVIKSNSNNKTLKISMKLKWNIVCDRIIIKFIDNKQTEYLYEITKQTELKSGDIEFELNVEDRSYLIIKSFIGIFGNVLFDLNVLKLKDHKIQLETIGITTSWPFEQEIAYSHIYTPIRYIIKGVNQKHILYFKWSSELEIGKIGWLDNQQIVISNKAQIQINIKEEQILQIFIIQSNKKVYNYAAIQLKIGNFTLKQDYAIKPKSPISVNFRYEDKNIQYIVTNISGNNLQIENSKGKKYDLENEEILSVTNNKLFIGLTSNSLIEVILDNFCSQKIEVSRNSERFALRLETQELKLFKIIRFKSDVIGNIRILAREGYELVGKIKGNIGYKSQQEQILQVGIVPTRKGKIILPDVQIDNKKGQWKHPIILQVL